MMTDLERKLPTLPLALKQEILAQGRRERIPAGTEVLREGQYVKTVPLVLEGSLKVVSSYDDKELLLYYIEPEESCVMSFIAALWHNPSKVIAIAEQDSEVLFLPVDLVRQWIRTYPALTELLFQQFDKRYEDLLETIHQVLFGTLDKRLYDYLQEKAAIQGTKLLNLRHHQIARELGTAREVVSRVLKKLEKENKVRQQVDGIEIL